MFPHLAPLSLRVVSCMMALLLCLEAAGEPPAKERAATQPVRFILEGRLQVLACSPDGKTAHAKMANGKAEVKLARFNGQDPNKPTQIANLKYFAATWNSPFISMYGRPASVQVNVSTCGHAAWSRIHRPAAT